VMDYGIFVLDRTGHIVTWNEGAQRIKGYTAEDVIGKHFSMFYTKEAQDSRHPDKELEIATEVGRYEEEGWRVRKDGNQFWASVVISAMHDGGQLIGFAKVTRDLTERRLAEAQREENARANIEINEELQRLAYVVSHELQAPISTILRYSNLLTVRYQDRLGEDANDFMAKISSSTKLIARMVDDLWTYARITKPNQELEQEQVYMTNVLRDAIAELKDKLDDQEVTRGELPSIPGNRQQFVFLFKELISNAIKYRSSAPPHLWIEARPDHNNGWVFSVKDNGIGIDKVYTGEIFKLYHRLKGGPEASATGMGLAICKKIVQRHRGHIWFESAPGQGSTFYFWLPN